jgi:hypothetical protein
MSKSKSRVFSREFKLSAVRRVLAGENVSALSRELKVRRKDLEVIGVRVHFLGPQKMDSDPIRSLTPLGPLVMPAPVAGIHVLLACLKQRRGWPGHARP